MENVNVVFFVFFPTSVSLPSFSFLLYISLTHTLHRLLDHVQQLHVDIPFSCPSSQDNGVQPTFGPVNYIHVTTTGWAGNSWSKGGWI